MKLKFHRYCIQYFQLNVHVRRQLFFTAVYQLKWLPLQLLTIRVIPQFILPYTENLNILNKHGCYRNNMQYQKLQ